MAGDRMRTPAEDAELTRLLRDWDRITGHIRALGVAISRRPGEITTAEWAAAAGAVLECRADPFGHQWPTGKRLDELEPGDHETCGRCGATRAAGDRGVITYDPGVPDGAAGLPAAPAVSDTLAAAVSAALTNRQRTVIEMGTPRLYRHLAGQSTAAILADLHKSGLYAEEIAVFLATCPPELAGDPHAPYAAIAIRRLGPVYARTRLAAILAEVARQAECEAGQ